MPVSELHDDDYWMGKALLEARKALRCAEVPIGAILVQDGKIIARGFNQRESKQDPTAHAELIAIRRAARKIGAWRLTGATLYVTLEPCPMCMGAILLARVERVVFACFDPKGGAAGSLYDLTADRRFNHQVQVTSGIRQGECSAMLSDFFRELRKEKKAAKLIAVE